MSCIFCEIAQKKILSEIIYEDDHTFAFLDIAPRSPGHTVVIPKYHAQTILDLPELEIQPLFLTVRKLAGILQNTFRCDGFTIGINHGAEAGQTVGHLHVHIMPRFKGDGGAHIHGAVNNPPKESLKVLGAKIRNTLEKVS